MGAGAGPAAKEQLCIDMWNPSIFGRSGYILVGILRRERYVRRQVPQKVLGRCLRLDGAVATSADLGMFPSRGRPKCTESYRIIAMASQGVKPLHSDVLYSICELAFSID